MVLLEMSARAENAVFPDTRKLSWFRASAGSSQLPSVVQVSYRESCGFQWSPVQV